MEDIKIRIYEILCEHLHVSRDEISDDMGPGDLPNWNSIAQIQLTVKLEKHFGIKFTVDDVMTMNTVRDMIRVISNACGTDVADNDVIENTVAATSGLKLPNSTIWGPGSLSAVKTIEKEKIAVILGKSKYSHHMEDRLSALLRASEKTTFIHRNDNEPVSTGITSVGEKLMGAAPELVMAVGGGSTIDTAKLAWLLYEYPEFELDTFNDQHITLPLGNKAEFHAIPTTFGSGAEASAAAVFSMNAEGSKRIILSDDFLPDKVILDPELGRGLSFGQIFSGAFDTLAHAIEGYVSIVINPMVDPLAVFSVKTVIRALDRLCREGLSDEILKDLCYAAHYGGIVQNHCAAGASHAIAHQLGACGISHGLANRLLLTPVMERNNNGNGRYRELATAAGYDAPEALTEAVRVLAERIDMELNPQVSQTIESREDEIIEGAMRDPTMSTNPLPLAADDVRCLLDQVKETIERNGSH